MSVEPLAEVRMFLLRTRPPVVRPISSKDTLLVLSNGQEIQDSAI